MSIKCRILPRLYSLYKDEFWPMLQQEQWRSWIVEIQMTERLTELFGVGLICPLLFKPAGCSFFKLSVSLNTKMYLFFGLFLCITIIHNTWKYSKKCSDSAQTLFKKNTITWQFPSFLCGIIPDGKWGLGRANFARLWGFLKVNKEMHFHL